MRIACEMFNANPYIGFDPAQNVKVVISAEAIYTRALGKWHNYEAHLTPVRSRLAPWVKHWGYVD